MGRDELLDLARRASSAVGDGRGRLLLIAEPLPKTVAAHVEHILAKLGVGRRTEIAAGTASIAVLHSAPHGQDREE